MKHATIAAIATGPGRGGIGVIRLSGPNAVAAAQLVVPSLPTRPEPRRAALTSFRIAGTSVDRGLVLFFPAPHSFTGEDVVELHAHGSPRLLQMLLTACLRGKGVRLAEPGEFTQRAVINGRIDLTRAEAILDLVHAESEHQVFSAAERLQGSLGVAFQQLKEPLLRASVVLEGLLDFPDESSDAIEEAEPLLRQALERTIELETGAVRSARMNTGARVVLYGPTNAGKSTLFNLLVGDHRALVDAEPGTTRDALEARLSIASMSVILVDTAGFRESPSRLEALGLQHTQLQLQQCDLAVFLAPASSSQEEVTVWQRAVDTPRRLDVATKADLSTTSWPSALRVSAHTHEGIDRLLHELDVRLRHDVTSERAIATERHLDGLRFIRSRLEAALIPSVAIEIAAGEVSLALRELSRLTGADLDEARLNALFTRFCIGK